MDIYLERIKPLFDSSGLTTAELERRIGIKPKTINKWNSNYVKSYDKYIPQIASYFQVSTDYLLGNTDDPSPASQKEKPTPVAEDGPRLEAHRLIDQLPPDKLAETVRYMKFITSPSDTK